MISHNTSTKKNAVKFILLLGTLSFFSDMVYEGARSISGPFFALLGASGATVGFVSGLGELIGNALRIFSGYFVDRTHKYWAITFFGYACIFAIPFLAFAHSWKMAALLIILERVGKAIRVPARDAMLSYATHQLGRGFGFGIHQLLDQIGGLMGPFLFTIILLSKENYALGFKILFIPACFALLVLLWGNRIYPEPQQFETHYGVALTDQTPTLPKSFWIFLCASSLLAAGYADFPLIAYHFEKAGIIPPIGVPIFYMITMGVSALSAITFGWIYDRAGLRSLLVAICLSALYAPCVFLFGLKMALLGMIFWGIGIGAQKSLLKAVVGNLIDKNKRGSAYGIFNTGYGIAWFLGSWLMGSLYDANIHSVIYFSVAAELAAIPFIILITNR